MNLTQPEVGLQTPSRGLFGNIYFRVYSHQGSQYSCRDVRHVFDLHNLETLLIRYRAINILL